jgi:membrane-associated protease RseP (regulator of RpoE activity)
MRRSWFGSLSPVTSVAAAATLALLLTTANASAQSRDDSNRSDSDSSNASADNDRSVSRDSGNDRSDQSSRSSRTARTSRQASHAMLGVTFYNDQSAPLEIRRVMSGSPAEEAGLERGDEILSVDGRRVSSVQQLRQQIDRLGTNEDVELGVLRDGRRRTVTARLTANQQFGGNQQGWNQPSYAGNRNRQSWHEEQYGNQGGSSRNPDYEQGYWAGYERARQELAYQGYSNRGQESANRGYQNYANQGYGNQSYMRGSRGAGNWQEDSYRGGNHPFLGVTLNENDRDAARVNNVYPNSPAEEAGIRPGDEIVSIDDEDVNSSRDVRRLLSQKDTDGDVAIEVRRNGRQRTLHATLTSQQQFLSSQSEASYRMGRRTNYGEQDSDNRARRRQDRSSDEDQGNDNY